ncbi:PITH domain-containing protein [Tanacetum coccineum]
MGMVSVPGFDMVGSGRAARWFLTLRGYDMKCATPNTMKSKALVDLLAHFRCKEYEYAPIALKGDMSTTESASSVPSASAHQKNQVDLLDFIDWTGVECLNQNTAHPYPNALKQFILAGGHKRLHAFWGLFYNIIVLEIHLRPQTVKLYTNKEHMGFSNVSDYPPSDTLALTPENLKGKPVVLKYVKFQNVRSLTIFIEDNQSGSDMTKVQKIILQGMTVETTDMKGLKKIEDHHH